MRRSSATITLLANHAHSQYRGEKRGRICVVTQPILQILQIKDVPSWRTHTRSLKNYNLLSNRWDFFFFIEKEQSNNCDIHRKDKSFKDKYYGSYINKISIKNYHIKITEYRKRICDVVKNKVFFSFQKSSAFFAKRNPCRHICITRENLIPFFYSRSRSRVYCCGYIGYVVRLHVCVRARLCTQGVCITT